MKIVRAGALPVGGESGLFDVRDRALAGSFRDQVPGQVRAKDVYPAFVDKVLSFIDVEALRPLRVVIDAANGMAGAMLPPVLARLPIDAVRCFFEPDGSFPNHEPNPLLPENREFIVLEKELGGKVIYDVRASWAVPETIERAGGVALVNRVGHAYIKHRMRQEHAVFAGEVSAHYYFRDFTQADSGVVPFLLMLELISKRGRKLSELLEPYRSRYFITGEINTPVRDVALKLAELEERFGCEGTLSHLDGVSVVADEWHFNVRPSNTEPLLRLNLEARSRDLMERKRDEVLAVIRS